MSNGLAQAAGWLEFAIVLAGFLWVVLRQANGDALAEAERPWPDDAGADPLSGPDRSAGESPPRRRR